MCIYEEEGKSTDECTNFSELYQHLREWSFVSDNTPYIVLTVYCCDVPSVGAPTEDQLDDFKDSSYKKLGQGFE